MNIDIKSNKGFTLIELLMVIAMFGVVAAIAFPSLNNQVPKWRANAVTRDVSGKLMLARLRAIQNNKEHGVEFTLGSTDSFKVVKYNSGTSSWDDVGMSGQASSGVEITLGGSCAGRTEFNPNGTAGGCNPIWINEDGDWKRKISMSPTTGKITVAYCESEAC